MFRRLLGGIPVLALLVTTVAAADDYTEAMAREHAGDTPVPGAAGGPATAGIHGEMIDYGGFPGYLAKPEGEAEAALIVIHEWWGLNDNIREMAHRFAAKGYAALAVDLYDGQVAETAEQARALMSAVMADPDKVGERLLAAYRWLDDEYGADRIGSIGWCLGGALSLRTALMLPDQLDAAVIYYGSVVTESARLAPLKMPILGIFGGQDRGIPLESVLEFQAVLEALGKSAEIVIYDDADHAFANPSGTRYQPEAAADAWRRTLAFLAEHLQERP